MESGLPVDNRCITVNPLFITFFTETERKIRVLISALFYTPYPAQFTSLSIPFFAEK